ncbi:hypothetical protein E4U59_001741 [Claviceps monticola]|nr:hypothetical protein E4U59_001741 [Claviceps monticola]
MKIAILVTSLLSLGASALPEAEESITVGEYTYTGGDLPEGELKVSDADAGLASELGVIANLAVANAGATMAAIHAMADGTGASREMVPTYASDK